MQQEYNILAETCLKYLCNKSQKSTRMHATGWNPSYLLSHRLSTFKESDSVLFSFWDPWNFRLCSLFLFFFWDSLFPFLNLEKTRTDQRRYMWGQDTSMMDLNLNHIMIWRALKIRREQSWVSHLWALYLAKPVARSVS